MKSRTPRLVVLSVLVLDSVLGCGGGTALVPMGPLPPSKQTPLRVGFPPPPAKVEYVPLQRQDECRFRDGYYHHDGRGWVWIPGAWVVPPKDCFYAAPVTDYESTDVGEVLVYREGGFFHTKAPHAACAAAKVCGDGSEPAAPATKAAP